MSPGVQVLLSGALTFGIPLVLAIREILITRSGDEPGSGGPGQPPPEPPKPISLGPGGKPLPACLFPPYPPVFDEGPTSSLANRKRELA